MLFPFGGATMSMAHNNPLLPRLSTFDDDDPGPYLPSAECGALGPLEHELGTIQGFEIDDEAAAAFAPAALSTLFKIGLGKFSSSAKSYAGSSVLELVVPWRQPQPRRGWSYCRMVVNADVEAVLLDYARWKSTRHCH